MNNGPKKALSIFVVTAFALLAALANIHLDEISLVSSAFAREDHDAGHGGSGHKGKGPKYQGGRGREGHASADSSHKGPSSHGGGSKTLEGVVFHSKGGHERTEGDASHNHSEPQK